MTRRLVVLGCGAQGRINAEIAPAAGLEVAGFLDDTRPVGERVNGLPVLGGFGRAWDGSLHAGHVYIVGLGGPKHRLDLSRRIEASGGELASIIHPMSWIAPSASLGRGVVVNAFAAVFSNAEIGHYVLIDNHSAVGVDTRLGDAVFIGPSAHINSRVVVGEGAFVGSGTITVPHVEIGAWSTVGANATVTREVEAHTTVVGSPARPLVRKTAP